MVVKSGLIITGKNPASAASAATAVVYHYDAIKAEFEPPRISMVKARAALVAEIEGAEKMFVEKLAHLKKEETAGAAGTADKIAELQSLSQVGRDFRADKLKDLDMQLERNAAMRQAALDAKAAAEAAAAEE